MASEPPTIPSVPRAPADGTATDAGAERWSQLTWLALLLALALAVRLPGLTESLWYDELWSTRVRLATAGDMLRSTLVDIHPPLFRVIAFVSIQVLGDSELAVRTLPLLAGLATVALMPALGAALATRRAGWLAGVLLALSPVHIWYSQEARSYSLIMLLTVLIVLAWQRLGRAPADRWAKVWLVVLSVALAQLHYFAIAIPAAILALSVVQRRQQSVALAALALSAASIAALLLIKWKSGALALESSGYLGRFTPATALSLFTSWFPLGGSVSLGDRESVLPRVLAWCFVIICTMGLGAWLGAGWRLASRDGWLTHLLVLLSLPALLLTLTILQREYFYIERSALPALPLYFLAVAAAVWLIRGVRARQVLIAVTVLASAAILLHHFARRDRWTVYKPNPDWRGIIDQLQAERGTPDQPLVLVSTTPLTELVYYVPGTAECSRTSPGEQPGPGATGFRGVLARMFPSSVPMTCGAGGTASVRLYVESDSGTAWVDAVARQEPNARQLVVLNSHWPGYTRALLRQLTATRPSPRPIGRARGLDVFALYTPR